MAKLGSRHAQLTINGAPLKNYIDDLSQDLSQANPAVTTLGSTGPERISDNYDWNAKIGGPNDFAAGAVDALIYAMLGDDTVAYDFAPTGGSVGADDPHYDGSVVLGDYSIKCAVGQPAKYTASFGGNSALARNVA